MGTVDTGATSASPYSVTVTVTDGVNPVPVNFLWTITEPVNDPPIVTNPGTQSDDEGEAVSLQINATDPEAQPLTYGATGLPAGLSINTANGLISGTVDIGAASASPYSVTVTVTDGVNPVPVNFSWAIIDPTIDNPPIVTNPGAQSDEEGEVVSLQINATDPEGQPLTYGATGLPAGLSINTANGLISGTVSVSASSASPYSVTVTVTDGVNPVPVNFSWTITEPVNNPPIVTNPGAQSSIEGNAVSLQINATDPESQPLTYGATGLPAGLSINTANGLISGTVATGASSASPYSVTVTVTDGVNPVPVNFSWTVNPVPAGPQVTTFELVDAGTNTVVGILTEGQVISLGAYPGGINIQALTSGSIDKVEFSLNGVGERTESVAPYTIAGDSPGNGNYFDWDITPGSYAVSANPTNNPAGSLTINITITN